MNRLHLGQTDFRSLENHELLQFWLATIWDRDFCRIQTQNSCTANSSSDNFDRSKNCMQFVIEFCIRERPNTKANQILHSWIIKNNRKTMERKKRGWWNKKQPMFATMFSNNKTKEQIRSVHLLLNGQSRILRSALLNRLIRGNQHFKSYALSSDSPSRTKLSVLEVSFSFTWWFFFVWKEIEREKMNCILCSALCHAIAIVLHVKKCNCT